MATTATETANRTRRALRLVELLDAIPPAVPTTTVVLDALDQAALEHRRRLSIPLARGVLGQAGIVTQPQSLLPTDDA